MAATMEHNDTDERRWDNIIREIDSRVPQAVRQAIAEYRMVLDETARNTAQLMTVVFGSPSLGVRGMVERMSALEGKIDTLIRGQEQREEDWKAMRDFLHAEKDRQVIQRAIRRGVNVFNIIAGVFAGTMTILTLLQLFHIISL